MKQTISILFEDNYIVVVDKPANFLSIPDRYKPDLPNVQQALRDKFGEIFTVHRLDRETSGILIFAKDADTHRDLSEKFAKRQIDKIYLAIVTGSVTDEEGVIEKPIGKHPSAKRMMITKSGKPSYSSYKVQERFQNFSLLEVQIKTGRTHQIRVHLQSIGYPLAVDPIYTRKEAFYLSEIKGKKYRRSEAKTERPLVNRCTLHAHQLSFQHPVTKERQSFASPLPKDLRAMLNQLRKWNKPVG